MAMETDGLRFGAFIAPFHPPERRAAQTLLADLDLISYLDQLGFDEAWVGEHHSAGWETISCPEMVLAAAAARTSRIRLGVGVASLPLHHPFHVAQRFVLLDHLSGGRALCGVGSGALWRDSEMLGIDPADRARLFEERLKAVTALLRDEGPVDLRGEGFILDGARLQPRPRAAPDASLYIASSFSGATLETAIRHDAGVLLLGGGTTAFGRFREREETIRASHGRGIDRSRLLVVLNLHLAEHKERAINEIRDGATREHVEYWLGTLGVPAPDYPAEEHVERMLASGALIAGSPDDAVAALASIIDRLDGVGGFLIAARDWAPVEADRRSWRLFAEEVVPRLRGTTEKSS